MLANREKFSSSLQQYFTDRVYTNQAEILQHKSKGCVHCMFLLTCEHGHGMGNPVTESREYGNPIPSQNASLSNNYNITSAVHNCMSAFQFARRRYARTLRTADMLTLFCKLRKTKNF